MRPTQTARKVSTMSINPLRKSARQDEYPVAYGDEVTEDQVRKIDDLLEREFKDTEWVTVEQES
jgi:hypothetical protein